MSDDLYVSVPSFVRIPRSAFEEGVVVVSAPDLDAGEVDELRSHLLDRLGPEAANPSLVVVNFDMKVLVLSEEEMRKMGWVRVDPTPSR